MCAPNVMAKVQAEVSRRKFLGLAAGLAAGGVVRASGHEKPKPAAFTHVQDLTHVLRHDFPIWPGEDERKLKTQTIYTVKENGFFLRTVTYSEHHGTHMDAPAHFAEGGATAERLDAANLFAPLAVIHIHDRAAKDPDAWVTPDDVLAWEKRYGPLPKGAFVAMHSGWERFANDQEKFRNMDASGTMHFPGFSPDAAAMLIEEREIVGIGVDTLSLDFGASKDFKVHLTVLPAGKYGIENLANLAKVPPAGAYVFIGGPKVEGASGGPTRAIAVW